MTSMAYRRIVAELVRTQGVSVKGFRVALRRIAEDHATAELRRFAEDQAAAEPDEPLPHDEMDEPIPYDEMVAAIFDEYFDDIRCVPAAYRIDADPNAYQGYHIHVWEIETSQYDRGRKLQAYGRIADGDGPWITLHIIDRFGREAATLDTDALMPFCYAGLYPDDVIDAQCRA